jgi:methyl-accepting chemotaxis protein
VLRLQNLRQAIDNAADFDDLSIRLPIVHNDEIDQVNESFNQFMTHLSTKSPNNK